MRLLYSFFIRLYSIAIHLAAPFNNKAELWVKGRKDILNTIKDKLSKNDYTKKTIWIHCASLGEFEQGRPLIESIKTKYPNYIIVLTFFSPSGFEIRKNYPGADYVFYLPIDTPFNAKTFVSLVNPSIVFFIKYEFWFNYLGELKKKKIPTYLISGIFRNDHYFLKWYGVWGRKQLKCFTHFFLQNSSSEKLLQSIGYKNTSVAGDTRFDRVYEVSKNVKNIPIVELFKQNKNVIIAGSTWPQDEELLSTFDFTTLNFVLIIAPHEVNKFHVNEIEKLFSTQQNLKCIKYSEANSNNINSANVLIIDNIGMLSSLYQYGTIAYIGGGFGKGIHNILEAATFGLPVLFGPNYKKFTEAIELINKGGAFVIKNDFSLKNNIEYLTNPANYNKASMTAKGYVQSNIGATENIITFIKL